MADDGRSRLGRGLAALIGDVGAETATVERTRSQRRVPIEFLKPNPRNPRRNFSDAELDELAASIRERGIIQPIVVRAARRRRSLRDHRRRAALARRATRGPARRADRRARGHRQRGARARHHRERAARRSQSAGGSGGYQALANEYQHSQEDIAKIVGKSRSHVTNTLRLLKLPEPVKAYINAGKISAGAARMLVGATDPEEMAREIVERGLNVRQVEALGEGTRA